MKIIIKNKQTNKEIDFYEQIKKNIIDFDEDNLLIGDGKQLYYDGIHNVEGLRKAYDYVCSCILNGKAEDYGIHICNKKCPHYKECEEKEELMWCYYDNHGEELLELVKEYFYDEANKNG